MYSVEGRVWQEINARDLKTTKKVGYGAPGNLCSSTFWHWLEEELTSLQLQWEMPGFTAPSPAARSATAGNLIRSSRPRLSLLKNGIPPQAGPMLSWVSLQS